MWVRWINITKKTFTFARFVSCNATGIFFNKFVGYFKVKFWHFIFIAWIENNQVSVLLYTKIVNVLHIESHAPVRWNPNIFLHIIFKL